MEHLTAVRGSLRNSLPPMPCHFQVRGGTLPTSDWHEPHAETRTWGEQIEEIRTVGWFREQSEKLRLAEEEEAREQFERIEEERIEAERALQVCVQTSASLHLCMDGVTIVVCGLQEAQRREEAARARKKKDAETALLETKLKELQKELDEARKTGMDKPKEATPEPVPQDMDDGQEVRVEQAGAVEPIAEGCAMPPSQNPQLRHAFALMCAKMC